ncbi:MAG: thiamine phosphate synthase [Acidobacteria bacterium]|nr:thiamine phosphate synthase [Acidobacteriota bacterium]
MRLPRLYPIIDTAFLALRGLDPLEMARALADAGVGIAQFRHKGLYTRERLALAEQVGVIIREGGGLYVVDDRADVALMAAAGGVHVGQDDLPPAAIRNVVRDAMVVGFSTHNEEQLRAANDEPVDYLALGPIFGTASKDKPDPTVGLTELARLRRLTDKPLVAIGGITRANARQVLDAGADSVAVISDLVGEDLATSLAERLAEWLEVLRD